MAVSRDKAVATFERKLLAAERQGALCNTRECGHVDHLACWAAGYGLLVLAMNYGRRRGLLVLPNPWREVSAP